MNFSGKIKSHEKPGSHPLYRRYIFRKTTAEEGGGQFHLPRHFRLKMGIYMFFWNSNFSVKRFLQKRSSSWLILCLSVTPFSPQRRVRTWFNKACCFSRLRRNFEDFSPNSYHSHLLLILTPLAFSWYICSSLFIYFI